MAKKAAAPEPEWDTLTLEQKFVELGYETQLPSARFIEAELKADQSARLHEVLDGLAGASSIIAEAEERTDGVTDCETCQSVHAMIVADDDAAAE